MKKPSRIMIATDAWYPQVNGVVRTLDNISTVLRENGHEVLVFSHEGKKTFALPSYPEIQLAFYSQREVGDAIRKFGPDCIHIATEGPIGLAVRKFCVKNGLAFTTSYHTRFAEYLEARLPLPGVKRVGYAMLRWFHKPSRAILTPTKSITADLEARGFRNVFTWTRGVDHSTFREYGEHPSTEHAQPVLLYVGRLAVEKGIDDFLKLDFPGTKMVIGDGPSRDRLQKRYPDVVFTGYLFGEELARKINSADVFVFPSHTDTFGLVMIEAMACGLPVAAYPVLGPIDVVKDGYSGVLNDNLALAVNDALKLSRENAKARASEFTWENATKLLEKHLAPMNSH